MCPSLAATRTCRFLLILLFLSLLLLPLSSPVSALAEDSRFFPETGKTVSGKFLQYWRENGGLAVYGFPITEAQNEVDPETGKIFLTQWFERNRFELHPENAGTAYEVLLGLLGKDLRREALEIDQSFTRADPQPGKQFFPETGHNVSPRFFEYWQQNGGLARFGYPINEEYQELDPESGGVFLTQWFERARFELHPENQRPYDVLLGLLGKQLKQPRAGSTEFLWKISADFKTPWGVATDKAGNFYVADRDNNTISKFDKGGHFLLKWGDYGPGDGQFDGPRGVAVDGDGNIYVTDGGNPSYALNSVNLRVQKFDGSGRFLLKWGSPGSESGQFISPVGVAVDSQNNVYVVDQGANRYMGSANAHAVQKFDSSGRFIKKWGVQGQEDGQFNDPAAIAVDREDRIYVVDSTGRVQKFDSNGQFLLKWTTKVEAQADAPRGIATDAQNNIYVTNGLVLTTNLAPIHARIHKFNSAGNFLASWGSTGKANGQFETPYGIAVDQRSNQINVYVVDRETKRLQKFRTY